jgi:hypothetical protein
MDDHMKARDILEGIKRDDVASSLEEWVQIEQSATAVVVGLLVELYRDKSYLEMGFGSLHAYCTERLGYSPSAASARIRAARAALLYRAIIDDLESKALSLTAVGVLAPHLTGGAIGAELLALARHKSRRDIKALIARRFPKPEAPGDTFRSRAVGDGRVELEVVVSAEVADKLQLARELARESALSDDVAEILSQALDRYIADLKGALAFGPKKRTLRSTSTPGPSERVSAMPEHREQTRTGPSERVSAMPEHREQTRTEPDARPSKSPAQAPDDFVETRRGSTASRACDRGSMSPARPYRRVGPDR